MKCFDRIRDDVVTRAGYFQLFSSTPSSETTPPIVDMQGIISSYKRGNISSDSPFKLQSYNFRTEKNNENARLSTSYIKKHLGIDTGQDEYVPYKSTMINVNVLDAYASNSHEVRDTADSVADKMAIEQIPHTLKLLRRKYLTQGYNIPILINNARLGFSEPFRVLRELSSRDPDLREVLVDMVRAGYFNA